MSVADPGEAPAPLFLDQTEAPRADKKIFGDPPPSPHGEHGTGVHKLPAQKNIYHNAPQAMKRRSRIMRHVSPEQLSLKQVYIYCQLHVFNRNDT